MRHKTKKTDDRIIGWHPVIEALDEGLDLARVLIQRDSKDDRTRRLLSMLRARRIPVQRVPKDRLDRITKKNHQGIVAFASPHHVHAHRRIGPAGLRIRRTPLPRRAGWGD